MDKIKVQAYNTYFSKKTNLTVARLTVNVLSPILRPLREAQAMSVTAGS